MGCREGGRLWTLRKSLGDQWPHWCRAQKSCPPAWCHTSHVILHHSDRVKTPKLWKLHHAPGSFTSVWWTAVASRESSITDCIYKQSQWAMLHRTRFSNGRCSILNSYGCSEDTHDVFSRNINQSNVKKSACYFSINSISKKKIIIIVIQVNLSCCLITARS